MSLFAKAKKARENKKGFTLVELIVVLVILAILAAILVPALLGWIDKAKEKQYVLDARNVYLAAQTIVDEKYAQAKDSATFKGPTGFASGSDELKDILEMADVKCDSVDGIEYEGRVTGTGDGKINKMTVTNLSGKVDATLENGTWTVKDHGKSGS